MREDLERIVRQAMSGQDVHHMRAVIEKELFHYDILFALDQAGLLSTLTFQGGTSLRLTLSLPASEFQNGKLASQPHPSVGTCPGNESSWK